MLGEMHWSCCNPKEKPRLYLLQQIQHLIQNILLTRNQLNVWMKSSTVTLLMEFSVQMLLVRSNCWFEMLKNSYITYFKYFFKIYNLYWFITYYRFSFYIHFKFTIILLIEITFELLLICSHVPNCWFVVTFTNSHVVTFHRIF